LNYLACILVVDDEPRYTRTIKANLEASGYQVLLAGDGRSAIRMALQEHPDLIIMDVRLPGMDGYEASRQIREVLKAPILMLTAMAEIEDKVKGLEIGADDYLTKPFSPAELLARIRALLRRSSATLPAAEVFEDGGLRLDFKKQTVSVYGRPVALTPKEYCLLCELVRQPGRIFMPETLLEKIWGPGYEQERRLVWQTVHRLRVKIEPEPGRPRYIHTCDGEGYMFSAPKANGPEDK
jgi:two-component system alkaline phosphatase synthesis response regulator PhoP